MESSFGTRMCSANDILVYTVLEVLSCVSFFLGKEAGAVVSRVIPSSTRPFRTRCLTCLGVPPSLLIYWLNEDMSRVGDERNKSFGLMFISSRFCSESVRDVWYVAGAEPSSFLTSCSWMWTLRNSKLNQLWN